MSVPPLSWVEINKRALLDNVRSFKSILAPTTKLCAVVKANAYGHGLVECSKIFIEGGAEWLAVHALFEAEILRNAGVTVPIYIIGYVALGTLEQAINLDCRFIVYNDETVEALGKIGKPVNVHIKVETGTHRQGVLLDELPDFIDHIKKYPNITIEGVSTHFANIEDTTNDAYYQEQMGEFKSAIGILEQKGITNIMRHCSAASAALLFPESQFDMVRIGVSLYGMWPSEKVKVAYKKLHPESTLDFIPSFTWKARIAQIKKIPAGKFIGYGCAHETNRETVMAVIPIGYSDGYVRALSGKSHVLVHEKHAPILGRVSMNNIVVDVTDISEVRLEDEAVLLGKQGNEEITNEMFAAWADTINYEIPTRIPTGVNTNIPRIVVD